MSFDVSFIPRPSDGNWPSALAAQDDSPKRGQRLNYEQLSNWQRIQERIAEKHAGFELFVGQNTLELDQADTGVSLAMEPTDLTLSAPMANEEAGVCGVADLLTSIAAIVEAETGLVAVDPMSAGPFLAPLIDPDAVTDLSDPEEPAAQLVDGRPFEL